jgi:hypothetical protein
VSIVSLQWTDRERQRFAESHRFPSQCIYNEGCEIFAGA